MESVFFIVLKEWGSTAVSVLLVFVVSFLIKRIGQDSAKDDVRAAKLREDITHTLNSFGERLSKVEQEYVKNDFFYREMSGWRSEINRISDQINNQFTLLVQNIMQLFNQGKK